MSNLADIRRAMSAINTATNVKPGDRVLLATDQSHPPEVAALMTEQLQAAFPGVEFVLVAGVSGIAIDRQDETDEEPE